LGTSQVIYFRFTDQGLVGNDGTVLLSPERYADMQNEKQRVAEEKARSEIATETIATFQLTANGTPDQITITDVSLKLHFPPSDGRGEQTINFSAIKKYFRRQHWLSFYSSHIS
jgi:hypothetical protein